MLETSLAVSPAFADNKLDQAFVGPGVVPLTLESMAPRGPSVFRPTRHWPRLCADRSI